MTGTEESVPTTSSDLLAAGDQVKVVVDIEEWKRLQQGHGDWDDNMTEVYYTQHMHFRFCVSVCT